MAIIKYVNVADEIEARARVKREHARQKAFDRTEYQREYMRDRRSAICYVYVIGIKDGPLKIGVSADLVQRKDTLGAQSPYPLTIFAVWQAASRKQAEDIEYAAHSRLSDFHSHYEWFSCPLAAAIDAVKDSGASTVVDLTTIILSLEKRKPWLRRK